MPDKQTYTCEHCGAQVDAKRENTLPECCGKSMRQMSLDQCIAPPSSEHARFDDLDDACDDGRGGS